MQYLLFIIAFLFFAFIAPLKLTLATCLFLLLNIAIIRFTAKVVSGAESSFSDAAKAMALSFVLLVGAFFVLLSFSQGTGITQFTGLAGLLVFSAFLASYVLGFKLSLGLAFGASAVVAFVSSVASTAFYLVFRNLA